MRKKFVTLLLSLSVAAFMANPVLANPEDVGLGLKLMNAKNSQERFAKTGNLGTSVSAVNPETIWVGYWPGANQANNYWKVGGFPSGSGNLGNVNDDGTWSFELNQHVGGDSLSGWWMVRQQHLNFSGTTRTDENRPWWAVAYGNIANFWGNPGGGTNRTFGVTGVWHRDAGSTATQLLQSGLGGATPVQPAFTPLEGSHSAWMGMRAHGDITYVDGVTGNPFNANLMSALTAGETAPGRANKLLPGYIGDMDQMLYRNVDMSTYAGGGISIEFVWRTDMQTGKDTDARFRTGWHEGDGLSQNSPTLGNFVSAEAGLTALAPIDSLQLYIGVPVEGEWKTSLHPFDGDPQLVSLGVINPVSGRRIIQDDDRRWMNEVLMKDARLWLFGAAGTNAAGAPTTVSADDANVSALLDSAAATGQTNKLRVVFRVHTNRAFDDAAASLPGSLNSGYAGAAVIDDVKIDIGAGLVSIGDFNAAGSIDNSVSADLAWQSTGKPPATYFHLDDINTVVYQDICGPVGAANRICDLEGLVLSMSLHDKNEAATDPAPLSTEHEGNWGMLSPVINLAGADQTSKNAAKNNMNLSASEREPTDDYYLYYDIYTGYFDVFTQGQIWQPFMMSYPAQQADGVETWGQAVTSGSLFFNPSKQCFPNVDPGFGNAIIATSNANGLPDSIRVGLRKLSQCYRFGVTTGCSPTDGGYLDNCSFAIVDGIPQLLALDIWDIFNDAFPANENPGLPGTVAFDTATAHIKIGLNTAPSVGSLFRYDIPGDSITVQAQGDSMRLDLIFRIKPGVGNYTTIGNQASGLNEFGTGFFTSYKTNPGTFSGTAGAINPGAAIGAHLSAPSGWSAIVWNSARMDTTEGAGHGTFPVQATNIGNPPQGTQWCSTYHETELAARPSLGISRNVCFVIDTTVTNLNLPNVNCGIAPSAPSNGDVDYPPDWVTIVPTSRTGWDGTTTTVEGTKIIPDGLLTPGAHVQWFVRRQDFANPTSVFAMLPDTSVVSPQNNEGNTDGHRWQQFGVLPNRWNDGGFGKGGIGMACMLFFDNNDRRGNERVWKGVADSIGATSTAHLGNADGYGGVPSGTSVNTAAYYISNKNQQMGTAWDAYQMKASESLNTSATRIGQRLAYRAVVSTPIDDKWGRTAPTLDMLNTYYRLMLVVTGDLNSNIWGPFVDATADDITTFTSWLATGNVASPDRGILVIGESFVQTAFDQGPPQQSFVTDFLATTFQDPNYLLFVPDGRTFVDVKVGASVDGGAGDIYGVNNSCVLENDVVDVNAVVPNSSVNLEYVLPDQSLLPLGVVKQHDATNPWISQTIGVDIEAMRGRFGVSTGRLTWLFNTLTNVFGSVCAVGGAAGTPLDVPNVGDGSLFVNFMNLKNNPLVSGYATVNFGLAKDDFVQVKVFDVSGRLVRTLADRKFPAGEHVISWDGVDNAGRQLPRGVYFTQLKYRESGFELAKKLTILR
jgi:hypothetical protein